MPQRQENTSTCRFRPPPPSLPRSRLDRMPELLGEMERVRAMPWAAASPDILPPVSAHTDLHHVHRAFRREWNSAVHSPGRVVVVLENDPCFECLRVCTFVRAPRGKPFIVSFSRGCSA